MSSRRSLRALLTATLLTLLALGLASCSAQDPQNTLAAAGTVARKQQDLFWIVFFAAVVVFFVVEGLLLAILFLYRDRPGRPEPAQVHGNTRLELAWTIAPALVLAAIAVPTVTTLFELAQRPPVALRVNVIGHQWWWEFQYPDLGIVTANELHLPVGETVDLHLQSADVIHSFWIPKLGGKEDVIPLSNVPASGAAHTMWLRGDQIGDYDGQCAEFCGIQHANMRIVAKVQSLDDFNDWVRQQRTPPSPPSGDAAQGAQVFLDPANQCIACHTVQGSAAVGKTGPDLTHFGSRTTIAGAMVEKTPENLRAWLRNPDDVKPGTLMGEAFRRSNIQLSEEQVTALMAYLDSLQ